MVGYAPNHTDQILTEDSPLAPWNGDGNNYSHAKAESERSLNAIIDGNFPATRCRQFIGISA